MAKRHPYRKKWGQNFLRDPNSITKIINLIGPQKKDVILEIGPGDGALTGAMHHKAAHVHAVEIDPLLVEYLSKKKYENVTIHESDILDWDLSILNEDFKVVGNLPYYISTPILFKFLEKMNWQQMIFMFQKELADRIIAKPNTSNYGRLTILTNWKFTVKKLFDISPNSFFPKPKVTSTLLFLRMKENFNLFKQPENLEKITKIFFNQRRKKIKNKFKRLFDNYEEIAENLGIDLNCRPQNLKPEVYYNLVHELEKLR